MGTGRTRSKLNYFFVVASYVAGFYMNCTFWGHKYLTQHFVEIFHILFFSNW